MKVLKMTASSKVTMITLRKKLKKQLQKRVSNCSDTRDLVAKVVLLLQDQVPGGLGDNKPDLDFDPKQLEKGIEIEMEHTDNKDLAKEIAKDHLSEVGNYYLDGEGKSRLKELEDQAEKELRS